MEASSLSTSLVLLSAVSMPTAVERTSNAEMNQQGCPISLTSRNRPCSSLLFAIQLSHYHKIIPFCQIIRTAEIQLAPVEEPAVSTKPKAR